MKMNLRWGAALAATAAVGLALSACTASGSTATSTSSGPVTITVMGIPATTKPAARQAFMDDIAAFEKANPNITVTPTDEKWNPQSYVTELAGGTAPTLLWVPLTDPPGLIARKQVADLTDDFAQLPSSKQFNTKVLEPLKGNGKLYGFPTAEYALGWA